MSDTEEIPPHLLSKLRISIPGYQLLDKIAAGGQATVYRARELTSGLTVAVKVLHGGPLADEGARERLRRETAALKALNHPNIVCVIASGTTPFGLDYLVMNFVEGRPLDAVWEDPAFAAAVAPEPPERLRLFRRICGVVQAAHLKGITHRDLSPSNILVDKQGGPHLLDFGLMTTAFNKLMTTNAQSVSLTGQFLGKLKYAAPEQVRGSHDGVDIRTDVYAMGVILYQILTNGVLPYEVGGNLADAINNIIYSRPLPPSSVLAAAPPGAGQPRVMRKGPPLVNPTIEAIVLKALEKDPADRYQSAGEIGADIDRYLAGQPTTAKLRAPLEKPAKRPLPARRLLLAGGALALIAIAMMNVPAILRWLGRSPTAAANFGEATPASTRPVTAAISAPAPALASAPAALAPQAIVLFSGNDTSEWNRPWPVVDGAMIADTQDTHTRKKFTDFKLHLEFNEPQSGPDKTGQERGNSGVFLQGRYEIQILDSYLNPTFPMGGCGAVFGFADPLKNLSRPPGEWQTYDITFQAARYHDGHKIQNARVSLYWNGKLVQDNVEIPRSANGRDAESDSPAPVGLQYHGAPVRFRNIWITPSILDAGASQVTDGRTRSTVLAGQPQDVPPGSPRVVDLLPAIDVARDSVSGVWKRVDDGVSFGCSNLSPLRTVYRPPAEYDLRADVTYLDGRGFYCVVFSHGVPTVCGFHREHDQIRCRISNWHDDNALVTSQGVSLGYGAHRHILVQVRRDSISLLLSDQLVAKVRTDGRFDPDTPPWFYTGPEKTLGLVPDAGGGTIHRLEVVELSEPGKTVSLTPPGTLPALDKPLPGGAVHRTVDLMPYVDFQHIRAMENSPGGQWARQGADLFGQGDTAIRIAYQPPPEYNLHFVFTQNARGGEAHAFLSAYGHSFRFSLGDAFDATCGFQQTGRREASTPRAFSIITAQQPHDAVVYVRKNRLSASVDGKLLIDFATDYLDLSVADAPGVDPSELGMGCMWTKTTFHKIEIQEITGTGSSTATSQPLTVIPGAETTAGDVPDRQTASPSTRPIVSTTAPASRPQDVPPASPRVVDLLPAIDVDRDTATGNWKKVEYGLSFGCDNVSPLRTAYRPPAEYDLRADVTYLDGRGFYCVVFTGRIPTVCGFRREQDQIKCEISNWHDDNALATTQSMSLGYGAHRHILVQVRHDSISLLLSGQLVARVRTDGGSNRSDPPCFYTGPDKTLGLAPDAGDGTIHRLEVVELSEPGKTVSFPPPGTLPSLDSPLPGGAVQRTVDLMPYIDLQHSRGTGKWTCQGTDLVGEGQAPAIPIAYHPPPEYNLHFVFTQHIRGSEAHALLSAFGHSFRFSVGSEWDTFCKFVQTTRLEASTPRSFGIITAHQPHDIVIYVREKRLAATVDGKLLIDYRTDYSDLSINDMPGANPSELGVGCFWAKTTFHKIEIQEITGAGKPSK